MDRYKYLTRHNLSNFPRSVLAMLDTQAGLMVIWHGCMVVLFFRLDANASIMYMYMYVYVYVYVYI